MQYAGVEIDLSGFVVIKQTAFQFCKRFTSAKKRRSLYVLRIYDSDIYVYVHIYHLICNVYAAMDTNMFQILALQMLV